MGKKAVPKGTIENFSLFETKRPFPSLECLTSEQMKEVKKRTSEIMDYHSKAKLSYQAVDYFGNLLSEKGFEERDYSDDSILPGKKFFYKDPWQKSSMIIVNQGRKPLTEGFRLLVTHADAPCLRIKPRPIRMEEMDKDKYNYLGLRLSTIPHGGVITSHWIGQQVKVIGYSIDKNRKRREISFPGFIGINSAHVESENTQDIRDYSPENSLEIVVGYKDIQGLLKKMDFKSVDDFATSRLWAVPTNEMTLLNEEYPNLLIGYGHDNRTTTFSVVDAIIKAKNQQYSSIVWVVDNEEIFDPAPVGTKGNFLDIILEKMLEDYENKENKKISVTEKNKFYQKSRVIIGDVTFAPSGFDGYEADYLSAAKIGLGTFIEGGDIQGYNPLFIRDLRNLTEPIFEKRTRICHQITGQFYHQDEQSLWYTSENPTFPLADKGVSGAWAGIPCACLHSAVETICPGDEYATSQLYKRFFESPIAP